MLYALAVVLVLILDQWLKYWVTINIALDAGSRELIPGIVSLVNIHNSGAAYGILSGGQWRWVFVAIAVIFTVLAVIALCQLTAFYKSKVTGTDPDHPDGLDAWIKL